MNVAFYAAAVFCGIATLLHLVSLFIAATRCRPRSHLPPPAGAPPVTLVRPVCGLEHDIEETLGSAFVLDYPRYELIFCVASARDAVIAVIERLMAAHPDLPARILIGDERISTNPKLNNVLKGWRAAQYGWIVLADSNVLMPRDYLQRLLARWRRDTGLVSAPPIGCRPQNFWAEVECAFLNGYQARWQYCADTLGLGFAQGKTMLWRRADLEAAGGIGVLAAEVAEDAAATKVVRSAGLKVNLVDAPFGQPLGRRNAAEVWARQVRWARLRRASFMRYFLPEAASGATLPMIAAGFLAATAGLPVAASIAAFAALWYGAELALARAAGWPLSWLSPLAALTRDALLPVLFIAAWAGSGFEWRGNAMQVAKVGESV
jgi:ceramide glucosyltransferase